MRYVLALCLLLVLPSIAYAQPPTETVILNETVELLSGQSWRECRAVPAGWLYVETWTDAGRRSAEDVNFLLMPDGQNARPDVYLALQLGVIPASAAYRVEAGTYCAAFMTTDHFPPTRANGEPTVKRSTVKITHETR